MAGDFEPCSLFVRASRSCCPRALFVHLSASGAISPPLFSRQVAQQELDSSGRSRQRRAPRIGGATSHLPDSRGTCSLSVETDPLLWEHVYKRERDHRRTREELTAMVASHIKAVNRVYDKEKFDGRYMHRGIQFEVQRLKVCKRRTTSLGKKAVFCFSGAVLQKNCIFHQSE